MNIQTIKNNKVVQNSTAIVSDKITVTGTKDITQAYTKIDSFLSMTNASTAEDAQSLINLAGKILYNEQFREIAINSNPIIKAAYENFIASIAKDDSELGEYIKSILSDSSKFSGEFFNALNKLMLETDNGNIRSSIYNFLKIFDYFSTQTGNAYGVNSSLNDLLSSLPLEAQNALLNMFAAGSSTQLNIFLLSIFDTKLPDKEKLQLVINYLSDFVAGNKIEDNNPIDIFNSSEQILSNEGLNFIRTINVELNKLGIKLPKEISDIIDNLDTAKNTIDNKQAISGLTNDQKYIIEELTKLVQGTASQKANELYTSINDLVKTLETVKLSISYDTDTKEVLNNIVNSLLLLSKESENNLVDNSFVKALLSTLNIIKTNLLSGDIDVIEKETQDSILSIIDNITDELLENLIYSDESKNKCELLSNIYDKEIMPVLLKNIDTIDKNAMSILTHNLLRLKLGTASEFDKQIQGLLEQLKNTKALDNKQIINIKLSLLEKLASDDKLTSGLNEFVKLLNIGIKNAANDSIKAMFENALLSMISKDDIGTVLKYYFVPFVFNGNNVLSEVTVKKKKKKDEQENSSAMLDDVIYEISIVLNIKDKGVISALLIYSNGEISAKLTLPDEYSFLSEAILADISQILQKNNLITRDIVISK